MTEGPDNIDIISAQNLIEIDVDFRPMGLNVDREGSLIIVEFEKESGGMHKYDADLNYVGKFQYKASGKLTWLKDQQSRDSVFGKPHSVDFNQNNEYFITDWGSHHIYRWSSSGDLTRSEYKFEGPATAYFSRDFERLYVADYSANEVVVLDKDLNYTHKFEDGYNQVHCIVQDSGNNLYVADVRNHRVLKYSPDLELEGWIGLLESNLPATNWTREHLTIKGSCPGAMEDPIALQIDENDNLYVLEWANKRIQVFNSLGKTLRIIKGGFDRPYDFKIVSSKIYLADSHNYKLKIFDLV